MERKPSLPRRFVGWLARPFRRESGPAAPSRSAAKIGRDATEDGSDPSLSWPARRLDAVQRLWGEDFAAAGEAEHLGKVVPLLGLSEKTSLLLVGAGLGGAGQLIVEQTGAWVTGYESEAELAALGEERTRLKGLSRRAPVKFGEYDNLRLKPRSFDTCVTLEKLYTVADKKKALASIVEALRANGELWYTDFALPSTDPPNRAVRDWADSEPVAPTLWPASVTQALLGKFNLDVHAPVDITHEHRNRVFKCLFDFLAGTNKAELREIVDDVFPELETLGKRIAALDSGGLKVFRFHAYKLPDKSKIAY